MANFETLYNYRYKPPCMYVLEQYNDTVEIPDNNDFTQDPEIF